MELCSFNGIFKFRQVGIYIYIHKLHSIDLIFTTHNWATARS